MTQNKKTTESFFRFNSLIDYHKFEETLNKRGFLNEVKLVEIERIVILSDSISDKFHRFVKSALNFIISSCDEYRYLAYSVNFGVEFFFIDQNIDKLVELSSEKDFKAYGIFNEDDTIKIDMYDSEENSLALLRVLDWISEEKYNESILSTRFFIETYDYSLSEDEKEKLFEIIPVGYWSLDLQYGNIVDGIKTGETKTTKGFPLPRNTTATQIEEIQDTFCVDMKIYENSGRLDIHLIF